MVLIEKNALQFGASYYFASFFLFHPWFIGKQIWLFSVSGKTSAFESRIKIWYLKDCLVQESKNLKF